MSGGPRASEADSRPRFGRAAGLPIHNCECAAPRGSWRSPSWGAGRWRGSLHARGAARSTASSTPSWRRRSTVAASPTSGAPRRWGGGWCSGRAAGGPRRPRSPLPTPGWRSTTALPTAPEAEEILARFGAAGRAGGRPSRRWPRAPRRCSPPETATARAPRASPRPRPPPSPGVPHPLYALGRARALGRRSRGGRAGASRRRASSRRRFSPPGWRGPRFCSTSATSAGARAPLDAALSDSPGDPRAQLLIGRGRAGRARRASASPPRRRDLRRERWRPPAIEDGLPARAGRARAPRPETEPRRAPTRRAPRAPSPTSRVCSPEPRCCSRSWAPSIRRRRWWRGPGGGRRRRCRRSSGRRRRSRSDAATRARSRPAHARRTRRRRCSSRGRRWRRAASGALGAALGGLGPAARARDGDLERLGRLAARTRGSRRARRPAACR